MRFSRYFRAKEIASSRLIVKNTGFLPTKNALYACGWLQLKLQLTQRNSAIMIFFSTEKNIYNCTKRTISRIWKIPENSYFKWNIITTIRFGDELNFSQNGYVFLERQLRSQIMKVSYANIP